MASWLHGGPGYSTAPLPYPMIHEKKQSMSRCIRPLVALGIAIRKQQPPNAPIAAHGFKTKPRIEMIPHKDFADACNFIAAYALEGEWLPKPSEPEFDDWLNLNGLISLSIQAKQIFNEYNLYTHLRGLGCDAAPQLNGRLSDMALIAGLLYSRHSAALNAAEHKATCLIN